MKAGMAQCQQLICSVFRPGRMESVFYKADSGFFHTAVHALRRTAGAAQLSADAPGLYEK